MICPACYTKKIYCRSCAKQHCLCSWSYIACKNISKWQERGK